jgi:rare lipoprotein A
MRKLIMGCAVAALIALSPRSEARSPVAPRRLPKVRQVVPEGEIGIASWYGAELRGTPTASGESFNEEILTAAHPKLPFGTTVRVTNLKNLASTLLRITDRGPGTEGRAIDVSWAAAKELGFLETGLARVEIEIVSYPEICLQRMAGRSAKLD